MRTDFLNIVYWYVMGAMLLLTILSTVRRKEGKIVSQGVLGVVFFLGLTASILSGTALWQAMQWAYDFGITINAIAWVVSLAVTITSAIAFVNDAGAEPIGREETDGVPPGP